MSGYIVRRALNAIPVLIFVSIMVFALTNVMSGDPAEAISGGSEASLTPEAVEQLREELGSTTHSPCNISTG